MSEPFDPYYRWLGIPPKEQPPHHYRLIGLELFEPDPNVIAALASRHIGYLQEITDGPHVKEAQRLLNELAAARRCLLDVERKAAYDAELRATLAQAVLPPPAPASAAPPAEPPPAAELVPPPVVPPEEPPSQAVASSISSPATRPGRATPGPTSLDSRSVSRWIPASVVVGALALLAIAAIWLVYARGRQPSRIQVLRGHAAPLPNSHPGVPGRGDKATAAARVVTPIAPPAESAAPPPVATDFTPDQVEPGKADGPWETQPPASPSGPSASSASPPVSASAPPPIPVDHLLLWLDAADQATLELEGDARIRQWRDKSTQDLSALSEDADGRPRLIDGQLDGKPVVRFSGAEWLEVSAKGDLFHLDDTYTLVFVARGGEGTLLSKGSGESQGSFVMLHGVAGFRASGHDLHAGAHDAATFGVRSIVADATALRWYVGGVECGSHSDGKHTVRNTSRLRIGCFHARGQGGKSFFQGDLAELVIYKRALPDEERAVVEGYLRAKWLNGKDLTPQAQPAEAAGAQPPSTEDATRAAAAADAKPAATSPAAPPDDQQLVPLTPVRYEAAGGTELRLREDGAILAAGTGKKGETYQIAVQSPLPLITAILLEALPDDSLPGKGPGHGLGGSFSVTEVALSLETPGEPPSHRMLPLAHAITKGSSGAERMMDGDPDTSWTVRRRGERVAVLLVPKEPVAIPENGALTVTLVNRDNLGCFRLLGTSASDPKSLPLHGAEEKRTGGAARFVLFVNVGGEAWQDPEGNQWQASKQFDGATFGHEGGQPVEADTEVNPVARTALRGIHAFRAIVPNGSYEVALYFSEHWTTRPERRVMWLRVEHQAKLGPGNVLQAPGLGRPYVHRLPRVVVTDRQLDIEFGPANAESLAILNGVSIRQLP